jgi:hypothetical protein
LEFPKRIYTGEEVKKAKELIDNGFRHRLRVNGSVSFKRKVNEALSVVKTAGYYDFLRAYIRSIIEIDGLTQLREADAAIWTNRYAVENPIDGASLFVQKANHMREYVEGKLYYGGAAEKRSVGKRVEFLEVLRRKSPNKEVREECDRLLKLWKESSLVY